MDPDDYGFRFKAGDLVRDSGGGDGQGRGHVWSRVGGQGHREVLQVRYEEIVVCHVSCDDSNKLPNVQVQSKWHGWMGSV